MARPKHATKPDACQAAYVAKWRAYGLLVHIDDAECWDVSVFGWNQDTGFCFWQKAEIKTRTGKLTPAQAQFQQDWPGAVLIVREGEPDPILAAYGRKGE